MVSSSCEISHKLLKIITMFFEILGIINQPILRERWIGISGRRTTLNGQELSTRSCAKLSQSYLYDYYISSVAEKKKKRCAGNRTCDVFSLHLHFFWKDIENVHA
jgi:fructose-1,6-bisphosphatase/inositol monophosphatase family enzyme